MIKLLDLYKQDKSLHKNFFLKIKKIIKKSEFINGKATKIFEKNFSKFCKTKFCSGVGNGTDALLIALKSLDLKKNDEVIIPAMTYKSTLLAVSNLGLKPIFVDIENNGSGICIKDLKKKINKKTKVIICVNLYGNPVDFKKIKSLIKNKQKIFIVEDSAQAHGAYDCSSCNYKDKIKCCQKSKKIGSLGDIACFSFYPGKNLGAYGDAGAVLTNSRKHFNKIERIKNLGSTEKFDCYLPSSVNSRLDTIQAIILNEKLKKLNQQNEKRKKNAQLYFKLIKNKKIKFINYYPSCVFHQFVVRCKERTKLIKLLQSNKIQYGLHYPIATHKLFYIKKEFMKKKFPNAEKLSKEGISLPIHPELRTQEIKKISQVLNSF